MSKTTLPKELEQQFDELLKPMFVVGNGYFENHSGVDNTKDIENIKDFIATAVAQAEERVKQQVLEVIGEVLVDGSFIPLERNSLRQQLREKVKEL